MGIFIFIRFILQLKINKFVLKLIPKEEKSFDTEEELEILAELGEEKGSLEEEESDMIRSIIKFDDKTVREVMTPRVDILSLPSDASIDDAMDLIAKKHKKPLWQFVVESEPEKIVSWLTFKYIEDVLTPDEALKILRKMQNNKQERIDTILKEGYPSYTTAAGWLGYSDEKTIQLCKEYMAKGWKHFKIKVGLDLDADVKRLELIRKTIGDDCFVMVDANQQWSVTKSIEHINAYKKFNLLLNPTPLFSDINGFL